MSGVSQPVELLVTDLDNTLWDWFAIWHESFSVLIREVAGSSGLPIGQLEAEIRAVHQSRGTSEYSYLLGELPSLVALHAGQTVAEVYDDAIHKFRSARKRATKLYPGVLETLNAVRAAGVPIVAYTESLSFYTAARIKALGLDGVIDVLYSSPDHDFPCGVSARDLRSRPDADYELQHTEHRHVPSGVFKPDPQILKDILTTQKVVPTRALYVGDSLMKDVAMAKSVGALDVLAEYGAAHARPGYDLLQRVSHWTGSDVEREREINAASDVVPSFILQSGFSELLDLFQFEGANGP